MSLEKLGHYSLTSASTVYDEEALTSLELAGRTASKVNEAVDAFNNLETETNQHLAEQDKELTTRLGNQDVFINHMNDVAMPAKVVGEIQKRIDDGSFDESINNYIGNLEERVDNLLANVPEGGTTSDAELVDIRTGFDGVIHENAGNAVREQISTLNHNTKNIVPSWLAGNEKASINLIDTFNVINGFSLNRLTGDLYANDDMVVSDYIEIEPETEYINLSGYTTMVYYDENKAYVGGTYVGLHTSPANAKYARFSWFKDGKACFYKGNRTLFDFIPYKITLPWLKVEPEVVPIHGEYYHNLFNKDNVNIGFYASEIDGSITPSETYFCTPLTPCKPNSAYVRNTHNRICFYDKDGFFISGGKYNTVVSPENTAYMVISSPLTDCDTLMVAEADHYSDNYVPYGLYIKDVNPTRSKYHGKTMVCFGDSITNMDYTSTIYSDSGITAHNVGLSSGRYANSVDQVKNYFAFHRIVDSIVTNDWTIPDKLQEHSAFSSVTNIINQIKTIDFSKIDFISIAYGTNDFSSGTELDNPDNPLDVNTVKGAMRYSLKQFIEAYPAIKILVATPVYRFNVENGNITEDSDTMVVNGKQLYDYCQAIIEVCDELHIPYVDNYKNGGINAYNRLTYFDISDGLHPNRAGREIIGHRIASGIINYC